MIVGIEPRKEREVTKFSDMIKEGAVIIDVATPYGDVDFEDVKSKAQCITPVPGGVGPMTITMLLRNVIDAYNAQLK